MRTMRVATRNGCISWRFMFAACGTVRFKIKLCGKMRAVTRVTKKTVAKLSASFAMSPNTFKIQTIPRDLLT